MKPVPARAWYATKYRHRIKWFVHRAGSCILLAMYLTLLVLAGILVLLVLDAAKPDMVFGAALIVLLFGGIISPEEALSGFSNKGMVTVGLLFVVSQAVENTGVFQIIADRFLGRVGAEPVGLVELRGCRG